jgi:hypothetical protein
VKGQRYANSGILSETRISNATAKRVLIDHHTTVRSAFCPHADNAIEIDSFETGPAPKGVHKTMNLAGFFQGGFLWIPGNKDSITTAVFILFGVISGTRFRKPGSS